MDSLYNRFGGEKAVEETVEALYQRVLSDPLLNVFFEHVDMTRQKRKFRLFLNTVLGGPITRSPIELRAAHSRAVDHGLDDAHFDAFCLHLLDALRSQGIQGEIAKTIMMRVEESRTDVLGY